MFCTFSLVDMLLFLALLASATTAGGLPFWIVFSLYFLLLLLRLYSKASISTLSFLTSWSAFWMEFFQMPSRLIFLRFSLRGSISVPSSSVAYAISAYLLISALCRSTILAQQFLMSSFISDSCCRWTWLFKSCWECSQWMRECCYWMSLVRELLKWRFDRAGTFRWMEMNYNCSLSAYSTYLLACYSYLKRTANDVASCTLWEVIRLDILFQIIQFPFVLYYSYPQSQGTKISISNIILFDLYSSTYCHTLALCFLDANANKKLLYLIYFICFRMRDERYYQRLNQIRQKYGYLNDINPEQEMRQAPFKRESMPVSPHNAPINNYLNNYDIPPKNTHNEGRFDSQLSNRRHKENYPMPPLSNIKQQPPPDRNYRERQVSQFQEDALRYNYERPRNERPSISQCSQYDLPPQLNQNIQSSSPIRKLQCELSNQNTPRQYANNQRPTTMTPLKNNKNNIRLTNVNSTAERSPLSRPYATQNFKENGINKYGDRTSITPDRTEKANTTTRRQQQYYKRRQTNQFSDCGEQGSKYSASINNIDKIQEKIQMALNKCKK